MGYSQQGGEDLAQGFNMKVAKVSFLSIIAFLLTTSNLYSQTERLNNLLRNNFNDAFLSLEKGIDKSVFEKESFENHSNQILKTAITCWCCEVNKLFNHETREEI